MKNMDVPIRVAQVIGKANLSGVDVIVMEYYRNIDRDQVQFDFIIDGESEIPIDEEIRKMGGRVYHVESCEKNFIKNLRQCVSIFRKNRYDIVHCHLNTLNVFPLLAAFVARIPIRICHNHSTVARGEGIRAFIKYALRPFAKLFATNYSACSEHAGKWLFGGKSLRNGDVFIIKNAIDVSKFSFDSEIRDRVRKELELEKKFVIGHVGRFVYQKNHLFLVDIFHEISKRKQNAFLLLIGSGKLESKVKKKVRRLGLEKSVLFLGSRTDVSNLLQAMDIFVFPSNFEGLGIVTIEAQAAGLRTIVSKAVPEEARITSLLNYYSLSQPASEWAELILAIEEREIYKRTKQDLAIKRAGYDIATASEMLVNWYKKILGTSL